MGIGNIFHLIMCAFRIVAVHKLHEHSFLRVNCTFEYDDVNEETLKTFDWVILSDAVLVEILKNINACNKNHS